jgi:hypothetical protein
VADYKQITLSDPLGILPDVTIKGFGTDGYQRSPVNRVISSGRTQINVPKLGKRPGNYSYYTWTLSADVTVNDANLLDAYYERSDERYGNNEDGHILLIDEYTPILQRADRTLVDGSTYAQNGQTYGHGIFKVLLIVAQNPRQFIAGHIEQIQFNAEELPTVV